MLWFLLAAVPVVITTTYTNALYAIGRPKVVLALMVLYTVLTWGIGLPLIRILGYQGIAVTVAIITYTTFPLVLREINRVVAINTLGMTWRPLFASLLMGITVYGFTLTFVHGLLSLAGAIIVGIGVYTFFLYLLDRAYLRIEIAKVWQTLVH